MDDEGCQIGDLSGLDEPHYRVLLGVGMNTRLFGRVSNVQIALLIVDEYIIHLHLYLCGEVGYCEFELVALLWVGDVDVIRDDIVVLQC